MISISWINEPKIQTTLNSNRTTRRHVVLGVIEGDTTVPVDPGTGVVVTGTEKEHLIKILVDGGIITYYPEGSGGPAGTIDNHIETCEKLIREKAERGAEEERQLDREMPDRDRMSGR